MQTQNETVLLIDVWNKYNPIKIFKKVKQLSKKQSEIEIKLLHVHDQLKVLEHDIFQTELMSKENTEQINAILNKGVKSYE